MLTQQERDALEAITKGCVERSAWPTIYDLCRTHFKCDGATATAMADSYTYGEGLSVRSRFAVRYDLQIKPLVNDLESLRRENAELRATIQRVKTLLDRYKRNGQFLSSYDEGRVNMAEDVLETVNMEGASDE